MVDAMLSDCQVQIFVKAPEPGKVKTRLAKSIGDDLASQFACLQFQYLYQEIKKQFDVKCWVEGDEQHALFDRCRKDNTPIQQQVGHDLGEKMFNSACAALTDYKKIIVVGSDCTGLDQQALQSACDALDDHDMVFVPAEDGGFVLWGTRVLNRDLFVDIAWGQPVVWAQTTQRLRAQGIAYAELKPSWDLDTIQDIKQHINGLPPSFHQFFEENQIVIAHTR